MAADGVRTAVTRRDRLPPSQKIVTIYNGVDTQRFRPPAAAERAAPAAPRLRAQDFVVGMIAGLRPEKNHDVPLAALATLTQELPRLKVLLVGVPVRCWSSIARRSPPVSSRRASYSPAMYRRCSSTPGPWTSAV